MPSDDIKALYDQAEKHLKAKQRPREDTIVDGVPPPAPHSAPAPKAVSVVPRPSPKKEPQPELLSEPPHSAPEHTPLPSVFPESEAPTAATTPEARRRAGRRIEEFRTQAPVSMPLSAADARRAKKAKGWDPPDWLVGIAKWAAPPVMLCLMAGAYWFQAKVSLAREQADALSEIRKQKELDYAKMKKDLAALEEKLGKAQAERDSARAAGERQKFLCSQGALKVTK